MATAQEFLNEAPADESVNAKDFLTGTDAFTPFGGRGVTSDPVQREPYKESTPPVDMGVVGKAGEFLNAAETMGGKAVAGAINLIPRTINAGKQIIGRGEPSADWVQPGKNVIPSGAMDFLQAVGAQSIETVLHGTPSPEPSAMATGLAAAGRKAADSFLTPGGLASLPFFELKAVRAAMLASTVSHAPEQVEEIHKVFTSPDSTPSQKWEALGDAGVNIAMAAGMVLSLKPAEVRAKFTPEEAGKIAETKTSEPNPPEQNNPNSQPAAAPAVPAASVASEFLNQTADQVAPLAPSTAEALKATAEIEPPKNPGGAQEDLPPEVQAESKANNSKDAWAAAGWKVPEKPAEPVPVVEVEKPAEPVVVQPVNKGLVDESADSLRDRRKKYWSGLKRAGLFDLQDGSNIRLNESEAQRGKFDVWHTDDGVRTRLNDPASPMSMQEAQDFAVQYAMAKDRPQNQGQIPIEGKPSAVATPPPEPPTPNKTGRQPGDKVMVRLSEGRNAEHPATVQQVQPDGEVQVNITKGPHKGKSIWVKPNLVSDTSAKVSRALNEKEFEGLSPQDRTQARKDSKAFDDLIKTEGEQFGWYAAEHSQGGETQGQRRAAQDALERGREKAFKDAGIEGNSESPVDRAKGLKKLQEHIANADPDWHIPGVSAGDWLGVDEEAPPEPTKPKLLSGEDQGDLISSTQSEDFKLTGEKGSDAERIAADKAQAEKDRQEAIELEKQQQQEMIGMGGAVPGEFEKSPQTPTSTRNAQVDSERARRGLPAAMQPARREFGEVWDRAMAIIDQDPGSQDRLFDELREKPRALTDVENAMLLHRQIDLQNDYGKATRDAAQAYDDGNQEGVQEARVRTARLSDELLDIYNIGKKVGTETGRGLNARKMMAYEDFTLAKMELDKRAANDGRPLTDAEREELAELHKRIQETQEAFDKHRAEQAEKISKLEADRELDRIKAEAAAKPSIHPKIIEAARKIVAKIDARAEAASIRFQEKMGRFSAGIDPTILKDLAEMGASHLAHGALDLAEWSVKMAGQLGKFADRFKGNMQEIFDASQKLIDKDTAANPLELARAMREKPPEEQIKANAEKIGEKVKAGKKGDIPWFVQRIARLLVESGVKDREVLIDRVHGILKDSMPDITRRETMDAISGYGDFRQLSKDAVSVQLRGMKGEMQQIAKLEDMQAGKPPLRSGLERRSPTDTEREFTKKVNEAKKTFKVPITDPATQLKSALDTVKTKLRNEITDLERQIAAKQKTIKDRAPTPTDAAADALRAKRDAVKAEYDKMFSDPEAAYQKALQEYKNRVSRNIETLQDKLDRGGYSRTPRRELKLDNEALRLKAENERLKQKFRQGLNRDRMKQRTPWEKTMDTLVKWFRGFILSGPVTLAKLTSAAISRGIITPLEEGAGHAIGALIPSVAEKAPRQGGGFNARAEVKSITEGFTKGMADAWKTLRTGKSDLELVYGKDSGLPQSFIDIFGNVHGALKAPVKRAEFARSFEKRADYYARQGVDITDEFVQTKIGLEAYQDAQRSIFMQSNLINKMYKRALTVADEADKRTGHPPLAAKALGTSLRTLLPIVKVPTNIVAETMQYALGSVTGSIKLAKAFRDGIEKLSPEDADLIMRHLKKGSLGGAVMLAGFLAPDMLGGFYQQGEKRNKKDIKPDAARIGGHDIPSYYIHNPFVTAAQLGATVRRTSDSKLRKSDKATQGLSHGAMAGALGLVDAVPFVREMTEVGKLMNPHERDRWLSELIKSRTVPQGLQSLAQWLDKNDKGQPIKRDPKGLKETLETGVPFLRQNVPKVKKQD